MLQHYYDTGQDHIDTALLMNNAVSVNHMICADSHNWLFSLLALSDVVIMTKGA